MQSLAAGAARGWAEPLNSPQSPGVQRLFLPGGHDGCTGCRCLTALVLRQFQVMVLLRDFGWEVEARVWCLWLDFLTLHSESF